MNYSPLNNPRDYSPLNNPRDYSPLNNPRDYSLLNNPRDYSPLLRYSQEMRYNFAEFLIFSIHWRKQANGNSKLSRFFLC
jgi:hypothetical protein